jgi:hypothetical protein
VSRRRVALATRHARARQAAGLAVVASLLSCSCEQAYPEVIVVNRLGDAVQVKQVSFSGCLWDEILSNDAASSPGRCLPGEDRVHFQKFDAASFCQTQAKDGTIDGVCPCHSDTSASQASVVDSGLTNVTPLWFNYQTLATISVGYGDFRRIELRSGELEQDFSIPGPYGH